MSPGRETSALAEDINLGRVGVDRLDTSSRVGRVATPDRPRRLTLPLVGRAEEHSRLVEAFHQVAREKAQAVVLIGAAGVGKTRLVNTFRDWALLELAGDRGLAGSSL